MSLIPSIQTQERAADSGLAKRNDLIRGRDDLWGRIASALKTDPSEINLEDCRLNPSGYALRCKGRSQGERFYAKVYLSSRIPTPPRFAAPWNKGETENRMVRPVCDQLRKEWSMTRHFRKLPGAHHVPVPRGVSYEGKTIVWDLATGDRLDRIAQRSWLRDRRGTAVGQALFQAGQWLRGLHDSTAQGSDEVDLDCAIRDLGACMRQKSVGQQFYIKSAIQILKNFAIQEGMTHFSFPMVLSHGDFCPANLIWESKSQALTVVDFELAGRRSALCDLFALVADLRFRLLIPSVPKSTIHLWEKSFWEGYGGVAPLVRELVGTLALARIFYHTLPRLLTRGKRHGFLAGLTARAYRAFAERWVSTRRLDLPNELWTVALASKA